MKTTNPVDVPGTDPYIEVHLDLSETINVYVDGPHVTFALKAEPIPVDSLRDLVADNTKELSNDHFDSLVARLAYAWNRWSVEQSLISMIRE